jgi:hypothetical protein
MSTQRAVHRIVTAQRHHAAAAGSVLGSAAAPAAAMFLRPPSAALAQAARPYSGLCTGAADAVAHSCPSSAVAASSSVFASIRRASSGVPHRAYSSSTAHAASARRTAQPTRTAKDDNEWDKLRKSKDPFLTTLDPSTQYPKLPPNELEINNLSFQYGLPPLPSLGERIRQYNVEQSYYDRRDSRIRDHLNRLLRMKKMSKKEMLILIDQIESSHWNLSELQKAYLPETRHAEQDDQDAHRKSLQVGTGGVAYKAAYKKHLEEKLKAREANGPKAPTGDGSPKYGYRKDLVNMGPERQ